MSGVVIGDALVPLHSICESYGVLNRMNFWGLELVIVTEIVPAFVVRGAVSTENALERFVVVSTT